MSETTTTTVEEQQLPIEPTVAVEAPVAPVVAELPEQRYEYQPTDENGMNMGGKQVLKYRTTEELIQKLQEQNVLLQRKWREETRKNRLGISDKEEIPETAPRFSNPVEFKKGTLTLEQRLAISQGILDPEKFEEVADGISEYTFGAKPEAVRNLLTNLQQKELERQAKIEADAFVATTPEYVKCDSNFQSITSWMVKHGLDPVRENFRIAFETLRPVLIVKETATPVSEVAAPVVEPTVVVPPSVAPPPAHIPGLPSGVNRGQGAADAGVQRSAGDDITYEVKDRAGNTLRVLKGMAAINAMPSEEMKRRMRNKDFVRAVDRLETEAAARRVGVGIPSILDR